MSQAGKYESVCECYNTVIQLLQFQINFNLIFSQTVKDTLQNSFAWQVPPNSNSHFKLKGMNKDYDAEFNSVWMKTSVLLPQLFMCVRGI